MHRPTFLVSAFACCLMAGGLRAQNIDAGPFLAFGASYFVKPGTRDSAGALVPFRECFTKKCGLMAGSPAGPGGTRPNFTFSAMFPDPAQPTGVAAINIDALSIGADILWVDPNITATVGRINHAAGTLLGISVSVTTDVPTTAGAIRTEALTDADSIGADVFTYISTLSTVPPGYSGQVFRSLDAGDLQLDTPPAFPRPDIGALDSTIQAYYLDDAFVALLPPPTVYFSVTDGTKNNVPVGWRVYEGTPLPGLASGACVYKTTWNPTTTSWGLPEIAFRPADLGLVAVNDVDALAIDSTYAPDLCIVYSTTTGAPVGDELVFVAITTTDGTLGPVSYTDSDGSTVTSKLGTGARVDAVCGSDPGPLQSGLRRYLWGSLANVPAPPPSSFISTLRCCYSVAGGPPLGEIESFLSGWRTFPPPGGGEFAVLALTTDDPTTWSPLTTFVPHALLLRTVAANQVESAALRYPAPVFYTMTLHSFWVCLSFDGALYSSSVTQIRL